jgi:serine/threonine protein kinase
MKRVEHQLGKYRLKQLLGKGAFADVYFGEHLYLNTPVAVKVLHSRLNSSMLYASKMIMRPERETKEYRDPCPGQKDSRYAEGSLREPGLTPENAAPDPRAAAHTCCGDEYASRPVARPAKAIQCG